MSRDTHILSVGAAVSLLILAPWFAAFSTGVFAPALAGGRIATGIGEPAFSSGDQASAGCGCDSLVVNATNVLRNAKLKTGDATITNVSLTYMRSSYVGDINVEIAQQAKAQSGDAVGGQVIGALPAGHRCHNILIRAVNILDHVKLKTGDATAINRNIVLLDPGIDPGRVHVDADQQATAKAGDAIAGQTIGALGGGSGKGCGSVRVEATNIVNHVKIKTGDATIDNQNSVIPCSALGCAAELASYLPDVGSVDVCDAEGCHPVSAAALGASLAVLPDPTPVASPAVGIPTPTPDETPPPGLTDPGTPTPSPQPTPTATPAPDGQGGGVPPAASPGPL